MKIPFRHAAILSVAAVVTIAFAAPAQALFPGQDRVAFVRFDGDNASVRTMEWDGSGQKAPIKAPGAGAPRFLSASLSPDGSQILYSRLVAGGNIDLYVKTIGGGTDRITNTPGIWEYSGTWSPNGNRIVYSETDNTSYGAVIVAKPDGSTHVPIVTSGMDYMWYPTWSPDGTRIAFSTSDGSDREIYVAPPVAGAKAGQITDNTVEDFVGDWSPNGARIALVREAAPAAPTFLSGRRLVALVAPHGVSTLGDVFTIRANGTNPFQVTVDTSAFGRVVYGPHNTLLVSRLAHVSLDIYSVSTGGGAFTRLTKTSETYNTVDLAKYFITA